MFSLFKFVCNILLLSFHFVLSLICLQYKDSEKTVTIPEHAKKPYIPLRHFDKENAASRDIAAVSAWNVPLKHYRRDCADCCDICCDLQNYASPGHFARRISENLRHVTSSSLFLTGMYRRDILLTHHRRVWLSLDMSVLSEGNVQAGYSGQRKLQCL